MRDDLFISIDPCERSHTVAGGAGCYCIVALLIRIKDHIQRNGGDWARQVGNCKEIRKVTRVKEFHNDAK